MSKQLVEMFSAESALKKAEELGIHEAVAKLNIFRALFHRPNTAKAVSELLFSFLFDAALEHRQREFVIMRIGWVTGSEYEWAQHWPLSTEFYGCTREEILAVRDWRAADCFDESDCAVLSATDELLETGDLSDEGWARCEAALSRNACIDLVAAVGTWRLVSTLARGLRVPLEEGVESWPPDGEVPPAAKA